MTDSGKIRRNRSVRAAKRTRGPAVALGVVALLAVLAAIVAGVVVGLGKLAELHDERCRVTDADYDVVISSGRMVSQDVIVSHFGLTNGANLAEIDFAGLREKLLAKVPNIRDVRIERRMPNRVTVEVAEREPIARLAGSARDLLDGRVVDSEGVVFVFSRDVATLPIIREPDSPRTKPGEKLKEMSAAALHLVEAVSAPAFLKLEVQEIDVTKPDHVVLTLGDSSRAKVAWKRMGDGGRVARESLVRQLTRLSRAIASNGAPGTKLWNATDWDSPGYVYADDPVRALNQERTN